MSLIICIPIGPMDAQGSLMDNNGDLMSVQNVVTALHINEGTFFPNEEKDQKMSNW